MSVGQLRDGVSVVDAARRRHPVVRAVLLALAVLLAVAVLVPAWALAHVVLTARGDDRSSTDAIVVLGAAQFWGRPSPVLEARLRHAAELYRSDVSGRVVTVGGNQPGDRTTEAAAGRDWLVRAGVPASDVTAVPEGRDTLQSLRAVAALMAARGWSTATIVTDPVHEARSLAMARALGIDARPSPTRAGSGSSITPEYVVRETGGLLWFWLRERAGLRAAAGA
jgi:uncharacterized SAM-binding protein YcdF (DUF218 family)